MMFTSTKFKFLLFAATAFLFFPITAKGLDWRIIQDEIGTHDNQVHARGKVLFAEDFETGIPENYPGATLVKDPDGKGKCLQLSSSPYHLKDLPVQPGNWTMVSWKTRNVSGKQTAYIEVSYKDVEGKDVQPPGPYRRLREASPAMPGPKWTEEIWPLVPIWSALGRNSTVLPRGARSIELRFFHEPGDESVTLIDEIQVVDIQPVVLEAVTETIAQHRQLLTTAVKRIRALPDSPEARLWKRVVATHSCGIATQLKHFAGLDPTSEEFIRDSDAPLLFARRLADAAETLETKRAQPGSVLTYQTRPIPILGLFSNTSRRDTAGVLPYASQIEGDLANKVTIQACSGEYEPISIALWSPEKIDQVVVETSDLKGPAGQIPASNLDVKVVKCWYQRNLERLGWRVLVPRFLLNDDSLVKVNHQERRNYLKLSFPEGNRYVDPSTYIKKDMDELELELEEFPLRDSDSLQPFDLIGGQNKQIWITAKVPEEATAGEYSGDILFKAKGKEIARLKIGLQVLPFSLPAPKTRHDPSQDYTFCFYYRGWLKGNGKGKVGHVTKSEEQLRAELRMMYNHGIVAPVMLMSANYPRGVLPEARFRKHLQIMQETGMSGRPLYLGENIFNAPHIGRSTKYSPEDEISWLRQALPGTISIAREYGFTDVYFYGQDEASKEIMQQEIPYWQAAHEAGAKVHVSVMSGDLNYVPDELDLLVSAPPWTRERAAARHRLGHKIHCYGFPMTSCADPLQWRRNYGLGVWSRDFDGVSPYCFMQNDKDLWNELSAPDYNMAFPTVNGAVSTLALEAFREGADDVRYATRLLQQIEHARQHGTPATKTLAEEAFQWINGVDFFTADPDLVRSQLVDYTRQLILP